MSNPTHLSVPILTTTRFVVRPFQEKDLAAFARYRANDEVTKYQSWSDYSIDDAMSLFKRMDYSRFGENDSWWQLAIASQNEDDLVGDIAVHFVDEDQIEIGFTVAPDYQRQQVAFEAVSRFVEYVFTDLKRHRITATTDTLNQASYKLLEKLGFRREAHFVQNIFFKGSWGDEYQYGLLRSEFESNLKS
ncbi:GNAT family N-acetyltransferase [Vibrio gallicus]|uniref:GNAT family N-acetyltransferase n=1 Tax=Vibrio gallicus TaxID=190897 RepID=UPI0021C37922|nr:GNAT family protein [Vibrio gallicus]